MNRLGYDLCEVIEGKWFLERDLVGQKGFRVTIDVVIQKFQFIHTKIGSEEGKDFLFIAIYANLDIDMKAMLWEDLNIFVQNILNICIIAGVSMTFGILVKERWSPIQLA